MFNVKVSIKTTEWQNIVALEVWALVYPHLASNI